jgi:hypothetical protein
MKINNICILLICFLLCAAKNTQGILDYRIPENYDLTKTALLKPAVMFNEISSKEDKPTITGPRLDIMTIRATDQKNLIKSRSFSSIRVLPGSYDLALACVGRSYQLAMVQVFTVEAGKEYYFACTGKTKSTAKLVIRVK